MPDFADIIRTIVVFTWNNTYIPFFNHLYRPLHNNVLSPGSAVLVHAVILFFVPTASFLMAALKNEWNFLDDRIYFLLGQVAVFLIAYRMQRARAEEDADCGSRVFRALLAAFVATSIYRTPDLIEGYYQDQEFILLYRAWIREGAKPGELLRKVLE